MHRRSSSTPPYLTRADARKAGIPERKLRGPAYQCVFFDVYVRADVTLTTRCLALLALSVLGDDDAHVSHFTAAKLWKLWVPDDADVHLSTPKGGGRSVRRGIKTHVTNPAAEILTLGGVPVSGPVQCFLDLAPKLGLVDLVVLGDSLVKGGHATPQQLVDAAAAWTGNEAKLARRAAGLARAGVDSPMETRLRLLIVLAGLPEPTVNVILYREDGTWLARLDLAYPEWRVAMEYDGRHHAESPDQGQHDITRRELLDHIDHRLVVVTSAGIYVDPSQTLR